MPPAGRWVGGSMGPTGELIEPLGQLSFQACAEAYAEQAEGLAAGGVDILWLETLSSPEELKAAASGASHAGLPITATLSFDTNGRTMMGVTPAAAWSFSAAAAAFGRLRRQLRRRRGRAGGHRSSA